MHGMLLSWKYGYYGYIHNLWESIKVTAYHFWWHPKGREIYAFSMLRDRFNRRNSLKHTYRKQQETCHIFCILLLPQIIFTFWRIIGLNRNSYNTTGHLMYGKLCIHYRNICYTCVTDVNINKYMWLQYQHILNTNKWNQIPDKTKHQCRNGNLQIQASPFVKSERIRRWNAGYLGNTDSCDTSSDTNFKNLYCGWVQRVYME